jgi:CRP-like cAMP-binding protein
MTQASQEPLRSADEQESTSFLSDAGIELDLDPTRIVRRSPGDKVIVEGDPATWFGFVLSGSLAIRSSRREQPIAILEPGSVFGEIGLLTHRARTASVEAISAVTLWVGDRNDLLTLFSTQSGSKYLRNIAAKRLAADVGPVQVCTRQGVRASVRPAAPSDASTFRREVQALSRESLRRRFFSTSAPPDSVIDHLVDADHYNHAVWALLDDDGSLVGSVRCIRSVDDPAQAELAVGLADRMQGRGFGGVLVAVIGQVALSLGITTLTAETLVENEPMRRLLRTPSTRSRHAEPGVVSLSLDPTDLAERLDELSQNLVDRATRSIVDGLDVLPLSNAFPL